MLDKDKIKVYNINTKNIDKRHSQTITINKGAFKMNNLQVIDLKDYQEDKQEIIAIEDTKAIREEDFKSWLEHTKLTAEKSYNEYARTIKSFKDYLNVWKINKPVEADLIAYREYLKQKNLQATTINNYILVIRMFFKYLEENKTYRNIAKDLKGYKVSKGFKKDYLNREQIHQLLNSIDRTSAKGKRDYAICVLMLTTGMRTIEIARAKFEDYENGILHIQGKGRQDKTEYVKISLQVENAINEYLETRKNKSASDYLFTSISNHNNEKQLTTKSVSRIAKENLIKAGLKSRRLTAHSFRHTTATLNLKAGATMQETQQLLRHSNINTTMIYSHNLERENNNSEQRIANYIFN